MEEEKKPVDKDFATAILQQKKAPNKLIVRILNLPDVL